jgi:two-component system invasion response regulator UvrY
LDKKSKIYQVAVIDDHLSYTEGLEYLFKKINKINLVKTCNNPNDFFESLYGQNLDIVFMDIYMPGMNGIDATRKLKKLRPEIKVIALTSCTHGYNAKEMIKAGVAAYLTKNQSIDLINDVIDYLEEDRIYISPEVALNMAFEMDGLDLNFTERELEIIKLTVKGKSIREIAEILKYGEKTIEAERKKIFKKLGVSTAIELVSMVYKLEIIR